MTVSRSQRPAYWYGEGRSPLGARMLAAVYAAVSGLRRRAYARGWLRTSHPGVPVIVVGNISVGGTGKTPLTIALVERGTHRELLASGGLYAHLHRMQFREE